jgi:phosphomannomutase
MTNVIKFGTDGWRAIIAEDFTFANVRALAASIARYLKEAGLGERGLVIGYDTRFGSDRFAEAVAEVVTASGIKVLLGSDFGRRPPSPTRSSTTARAVRWWSHPPTTPPPGMGSSTSRSTPALPRRR